MPTCGGLRTGCAAALVLLCANLAGAILPPLAPHDYQAGDQPITLRLPADWTLQPLPDGLRAQRDPRQDLYGTLTLRFRPLAREVTADELLKTTLEACAQGLSAWRVVRLEAPADRPRVRFAEVAFRRLGITCRGYAMVVAGRATGTLGFAYADAVSARELQLDDLVTLVTADSHAALPALDKADTTAAQGLGEAYAKLYGDGDRDFQAMLAVLQQKNALDPDLLGFCGTFQPVLRTLKGFLTPSLPERQKARVKDLRVYCVPTRDFNAVTLGRNDLGPGFILFHARFVQSFARVAQEYASLRERHLGAAELSAELTSYSGALAEAVARGQPLPEPGPLNYADAGQNERFVKAFYGILGLVLAHEMAHYYLRHNEGGAPAEPFAVQQQEVAADVAAIEHLQRAADASPDVWEGGAIHAFGFLATLDNVVQRATGQAPPEWTRTHPLGKTRLQMAMRSLGEDDLNFRHDPWNHGSALEHSAAGVQVVGGGGLPAAGEPPFKHPQSGVLLSCPAGWVAHYEEDSKVVVLRRRNQTGGLPVLMYSCGGQYSSSQQITAEILSEVAKGGQKLETLKDQDLDLGNAALQGHLAIAQGSFDAGVLAVVALGIKSPGMAHGIVLLTPADQLEQNAADLQWLVSQARFP
ncbi:MAG: hypothetical protein HYU66_15760 [Armatimonadetes bacterium]|nr:hypothetical protein [Armatimonadota bacterium]